MRLFDRFKQDKLFLIILSAVLILGIFIRLYEFSEVGYWNDDVSTIPTGLLVFYPSQFFPGLSGQGEPILGNLIIGAGCMLSGEDFSRVSEIKPMFYPGREILIGEQLINAFPYCHLPIYLFGIFFFLIISLLAIFILDRYSSIFAISFYAFYPSLLQFSRWVHVDVIGYVFIALGLLFLWKAYSSEETKKEAFLFVLSFISFALSSATKLSNGIFLFFAMFILIEKYKTEFFEIIKKIGAKLDLGIFKKFEPRTDMNYLRLIKIFVLSLVSYIVVFLIPFKLNPKNLFDVVTKYQSINPEDSKLTINTDIFRSILNFLITVNIIDIILLFFSLVIFIKLIRAKKDRKEKFVLYLFSLFIVSLIFFRALIYQRVFTALSIGLIFLMSLAFSEKSYSIHNLFRIKRKKEFLVISLLIYIILSFTVALSVSPHFESKNPTICKFYPSRCRLNLISFVQKDIADYLNNTLTDNETFFWPLSDVLYYYIRQEQGLQKYLFDQYFIERFNRYPTAQEQVNYFKPNNQNVRYIILEAFDGKDDDEFKINLKGQYLPNHIIYSNKIEAALIYDLENLTKK
ncbi:hypothetical protein J4443_05145 [Candidatus Woesearchaeota archaeon]|nr:hypothetical protein [Candidatus Woesearchaeota archaeon]